MLTWTPSKPRRLASATASGFPSSFRYQSVTPTLNRGGLPAASAAASPRRVSVISRSLDSKASDCRTNSRAESATTGTVTSTAGSGLQDFLEEGEGARVVRLAQPEHGLLAHGRVAVLAGGVDQERHALVVGELAEGEHGPLLHLGLGIVRDGAGDLAGRLRAGPLREPEERLPAHVAARILAGEGDERVERGRI